jgi:hypothetical protein
LRFERSTASVTSARVSPVRVQPRRIHLDVELLEEAAHPDRIRDAGHLLEHARDGPLLLRAQLVEVVAVADEAVVVDLAERRGVGCEPHVGELGQLGLQQALRSARARLEALHAVLEHTPDDRETEAALTAHHGHARVAVEGALERNGDLALHLLGREPGECRDDLDLDVRDVGIGLDRRLQVGVGAERRDEQRDEDRREAPLDAETDEGLEHGRTNFRRTAPGVRGRASGPPLVVDATSRARASHRSLRHALGSHPSTEST